MIIIGHKRQASCSDWMKKIQNQGGVFSESSDLTKVQEYIEKHCVSQAYLIGGLKDYARMLPLIEHCRSQGIELLIPLDRAYVQRRLLHLSAASPQLIQHAVKRVFDVLLSALLLLFTCPLWLLIALVMKLTEPKGAVFYKQLRTGIHGKQFLMWKFRSMVSNAEDLLDQVKESQGNEMSGPIFKLSDDPRITRFGSFLRKSSLDELPQLINVLRGEMSLVGPRPLPVYETAQFPSIAHRRRLSVKPGLTCYWQIEGRSETTDFESMVAKDLRYIDNWSLWLDCSLFLRTIPAVLLRRGAK